MARSSKHHPPETRKRVRELLLQGTSVAIIEQRLAVTKSFIKRVRAEMKSQAEANEGED